MKRVSPIAVALALAWAAIAITLFALPHLPFQDLPNHALLLRIDRALAVGEAGPCYRRPDLVVFGYSLYLHLARFAEHFWSAERALRFLLVCGGLAIPVAAARLAKVTGGDPKWAALLALPLALSWPLRMGLLSYVLALPILILLAAELWTIGRSTKLAPVARLTLLATLCYLAHPLVFGIGFSLALVACYFARERRFAVAARLFIAFLPALLLLLHDLRAGAFQQIPGTEDTWEPSPTYFRPIVQSAVHLVTRSFGITDARAAIVHAPIVVLLLFLALRPRQEEEGGERHFLVAATLLGIGASLLVPGSVGTTWVLGDRVAVIGMVFLCVLAARRAGSQAPATRAAVALSVVLAVGGSLIEIVHQSREVSAILDGKTRELDGRYLTFRLSDCGTPDESTLFGRYDPERHLWAEALSPKGATPYLFAFSRYLPVWYDGDRYPRELRGPHEWSANAWRPNDDPKICAEYDRRQIQLAREYKTFDGVIVTGPPARVEQLLASDGERLAAGLALFPPIGRR
jgi:hypothetical protein